MQTWEYCAVHADAFGQHAAVFYGRDGSKSVPIRRDSAKGDQNDDDARHRFIAELGVRGWELITADTQGGTTRLYFKRLRAARRGRGPARRAALLR